MDAKYRSRKFILACGCLVVGALGLFVGVVTGSEFVGLAAVILGLYGGANVVQQIQQDKSK